ncbi:MAG: 3-hydroxyacyl-CoA dehydrogenase NAD-binding domain-containing protein [Gammaproteobacteria bacterium]
MNEVHGYSNWRIEDDPRGVVVLVLDKAGASANVLSGDVMRELSDCLDEIEKRRHTGLVITSGKAKGFIAGADITEFSGIHTFDDGLRLVRLGQGLINRIETLPFPVVAAVNGFALGGGLELAMACHHRVIADDPKAVVGLPEVRLGIHPGFGGTVRAPRLAGVIDGMQMMLTGRALRPDKALQLGLVDKVVPRDMLRDSAVDMALDPPAPRRTSVKERLLSLSLVRGVIADKMAKQVAKQARREHYPAPYAMIDLWRRYGSASDAERYEQEARSFARLMIGDTAQNLVRVFFLQDRLKGLAGKRKSGISRVHVVGAGVMGGDIAAWCALRGLEVTLQDRDIKYVEPALERARKLFERKTRNESDLNAALGRLHADVDGDGVAGADLVIEAIFEDAGAKQALYQSLEPKMKAGALLATNTSSIRLETLREGLRDPDRLVGLHFFNPVAKMPLVEVVHTSTTDQEAIDRGLAFVKQIDRLPLPCLSAPGFLVNRVLGPYMMEAFLLADEGVPLAAIDAAAEAFGMPMGPVELADTVGLDVALHVGQILGEAAAMPVPEKLVEMVGNKKLGRKTGEGFYQYRDGKPVKPDVGDYTPAADLTDRLILPLLNQVAACLREGIVADADLADAGVIFGTGFAPFTGGPVHYARKRGVAEIVSTLQGLSQKYGDRFRPDPGWERLSDNAASEVSAGAG